MPTLVLSLDGTLASPYVPNPTHPQTLLTLLGNVDESAPPVDQNLNQGWTIQQFQDKAGNQAFYYYDEGLGSPNISVSNSAIELKWLPTTPGYIKDIKNNYIEIKDNLREASQSVLGLGILQNVAYALYFLEKYYDHEPGATNDIYCFGFSRGAYTLRLLIDILRKVGFIDTTKPAYKTDYTGKDALHKAIADAISLCSRCIDPDRERDLNTFKEKYCMDAKGLITFLGEWDPVKGIIVESLPENSSLGNVVTCVYTALSIDEKRKGYVPTPTIADRDTEIKIRLFSGVHSDAGGGYAEHELSHAPLRWIAFGAEQHGLPINRSRLMLHYPIYPSPGLDQLALAHNSLYEQVHVTPNATNTNAPIWKTFGTLEHGRHLHLEDANVTVDDTALKRLGRNAPRLKPVHKYDGSSATYVATPCYLPSNLLAALYNNPKRYPQTQVVLETKAAQDKLKKKGWI